MKYTYLLLFLPFFSCSKSLVQPGAKERSRLAVWFDGHNQFNVAEYKIEIAADNSFDFKEVAVVWPSDKLKDKYYFTIDLKYRPVSCWRVKTVHHDKTVVYSDIVEVK